MMKISEVTVAYNAADTIEQTICSVLEQGYEGLEYIVIDGGSTDGTIEIIQKYENGIAYWSSGPDRGIYHAMNKGIDAATGDIIAFLNSDDWYEKDTLQYVAQVFHKDMDILAGGVRSYSGSTQREQKAADDWKELFIRMIYNHPGIFARRELFERYGGFDEYYQLAADYDWLLRMYVQGRTVSYTKKILVTFRTGGASSAKEIHRESMDASLAALQALKDQKRIGSMEYEDLKHKVMEYRQDAMMVFDFKSALKEHFFLFDGIADEVKAIWNFNRKVSVFGCGEAGAECLKLFRQTGILPVCCWDNQKSRWGTYWKGIAVKNPADIHKDDSVVIITSTYYEKEIERQLTNMGLEENKDYILYSWMRRSLCDLLKRYYK